ncbi:MAG: YdcH family protein [Rhodanobacter sp.]
MFENQQREEVEALKRADANFRRLYQKHQKLDSKVHDAVTGSLPIDDVTLGTMKREKLHAKDELQRIWDSTHAGRQQAQH